MIQEALDVVSPLNSVRDIDTEYKMKIQTPELQR